MSTQKGNTHRTRAPKYKNQVAFKNTMYDTSHQTKKMNSLTMDSLCLRCKGILEWKVTFKKYHPLTQPKKCLKCGQKTVKRAYYTVCDPCVTASGVCAKCGQNAEIVVPKSPQTQSEVNLEFEKGLKQLRERERRALIRYAEKANPSSLDARKVAATNDPTTENTKSDDDHLPLSEHSNSEYSEDDDAYS